MKFSHITPANLAKAANPPATDERVSRISDFSKGNTRKNADCSSVRCSECGHAKPATATDPYSWHLCGLGLKGGGGWGMAPRRCERWEAAP